MYDRVVQREWFYCYCLLLLGILCTVCSADQVLTKTKPSPNVITKDDELNRKPIGPLNKYELLNSYPTLFSTSYKATNENLVQIYDSNLFLCVARRNP